LKKYPDLPEIAFKHLFPDGNRIRRLNSRQLIEIIDLFLSDSRDYSHLNSTQREEKAIPKLANSEFDVSQSIAANTQPITQANAAIDPLISSTVKITKNLGSDDAPLPSLETNASHHTDLWRLRSPLASWTQTISKDRSVPFQGPSIQPRIQVPDSLSIFGAWNQVLKPVESPKPDNVSSNRWSIPHEIRSNSLPLNNDIWSWNSPLASTPVLAPNPAGETEIKEHYDPWRRPNLHNNDNKEHVDPWNRPTLFKAPGPETKNVW
jgi:hypothetical protein